MNLVRLAASTAALALAVACGGNNSPTAPTPVTPPTPTPTQVALTGTVSSTSGGGVSNATVIITDGPNAGRQTTTSSNGSYRIDGLTAANANVFARAEGFFEDGKGVYINGTNTLSFSLQPVPPPIFSRSGAGNAVFDMPSRQMRVRIYGRWSGRGTSNFIVWVGGRSVVNAILRDRNPYEGVHLVTGGTVEVRSSENIEQWIFVEER